VSTRLLLVEDDATLARALGDNFRDEGFDVVHVARGDEAASAARREKPELVVLDLMLPGRSGLDVLKDLRASGLDVPVLVLTAKSDVVDRVVGLELGADDYLGKPFALRELMARVRALLRRARPAGEARAGTDSLELGGLTFDFRALAAMRDGRLAELTTHDVMVLKVLAERRGEVVSRASIVEEVCGLDTDPTLRTVDNHVVALRKAIGDDPRRPRWLVTVRGVGYRLESEVPRDAR
jgi:DNA-binding response OmpR family regulator